MITSSEATRFGVVRTWGVLRGSAFLSGIVFPDFPFTRLARGIRLFPRGPLAVPPLLAHPHCLLFELTNSRVDCAKKIRVRTLAEQFVIVIGNRDFNQIQMPFM